MALKYDLQELLDQVTPENRHEEVDWGTGPKARTRSSEMDVLYEVINGERRELFPGAYECVAATDLCCELDKFAETDSLGRASAWMLFALRNEPALQRRPAVSFVSYVRWPANRPLPRTDAWDVVPNLAVEVVSRTNLADEVPERVRDYFEAGVELVWVIFPSVSQVYVYRSPFDIRVLGRDDELDAEPLLPGFRLPLARLFGPLPPEGPPPNAGTP